jgi:hypothetical protein
MRVAHSFSGVLVAFVLKILRYPRLNGYLPLTHRTATLNLLLRSSVNYALPDLWNTKPDCINYGTNMNWLLYTNYSFGTMTIGTTTYSLRQSLKIDTITTAIEKVKCSQVKHFMFYRVAIGHGGALIYVGANVWR